MPGAGKRAVVTVRLFQEDGGVRARYLKLAADEPQRVRLIDATLPPALVTAGALAALADLL